MRSTTATPGQSSTPASAPHACRELWERLLAGPLAGRPVARVILTHHHPDHVGLAGWFQARGAELWATRTAWLTARMLTLDVQDRPTPETLAFWRGAGMPPEILAERAATRPFNFADLVAPMPLGYRRIVEGEEILAGGRRWRVEIGHGHAPEQATLWGIGHDLVLVGDQMLPGITPNLGVHASEPDADPVGDWLAACRPPRRAGRASATWRSPATAGRSAACPPASPSTRRTGAASLDRLRRFLAEPRRATDASASSTAAASARAEYGLALAEAVGHLNHLRRAGEADRRRGPDGAWLWQSRDFVPDSDAASR